MDMNKHGSGVGAGKKVLTPVKGSIKTMKHGAGIHATLPPSKKGK